MSGTAVTAGRSEAGALGALKRIWVESTFAGPIAMIAILAFVLAFFAPSFYRIANIRTVTVDAAMYMVLGVGMTFVITGKGIDLSIGSVLVLSGVVMAAAIKDFRIITPVAMALAVLTGGFCGFINGLLITKLRIPDFVVTLAGDLAWRGFALVYAAGAVFYRFDPPILWIGRGRILNIPVPIYIGFIVIVIGHFVYRHTAYGVHVQALGGNKSAARRLGLRTSQIKISTYVVAGLLAGFAAIMITGRLDAIQPTQLRLANLHTIAAVIIGGTSLFGGKGSMVGTMLGAFLLSMIANAMILLGFSFFWQQVAAGVVILVAVGIHALKDGTLGETEE